MRSPVTQADWSEARNSATRAISSGWPSRPMGSLKPNSFADSALRPALAKPSVSVMPGAMALTRIPLSANSTESSRVIVSIALLDAE
jgi:hypothetical protein